MNMKKILTITILAIFVIGMIINVVDATHIVTKGKNKVKITNKEYKKLTKTNTKYKTITKTKKVTKYKNVNKTRKVNKTKTERINDVCTGSVLMENNTIIKYMPIEDWARPKGYIDYDKLGYTRNSSVLREILKGKVYDEYTNFTKTTNYTIDENYTAKIPYTITKKYKVKVSYKIRNKATIIKKVPNKYGFYIKSVPIIKTVKVKKTKYVYKYKKWCESNYGTYEYFIVKPPKGYKYCGIYSNYYNNYNCFNSYLKYKKKVTYYTKERRIVGYKDKKVKIPVYMTISSYKGLKKGKVHVKVWTGAYVESRGLGKIR